MIDDFEFEDPAPPDADPTAGFSEEELDEYAIQRLRQNRPDLFASAQPAPAQPAAPAYSYLDDDEAEGPLLQKLEARLTQKQKLVQELVADALGKVPKLSQANQGMLATQLSGQPLDALEAMQTSGGHVGMAMMFLGHQAMTGDVTPSAIGVANSPVNSGVRQGSYTPKTLEEKAHIDAFKAAFGSTYKDRAEFEADITTALGG